MNRATFLKGINISLFFINTIRKILFLIILVSTSIKLQSQIATHPLFMQIKTPRLESNSGEIITGKLNEFYINSSLKDSVDISFSISVPKEMLSEKWAISLTPTIKSSATNTNGVLKEVVVKGWRFAQKQDDEYEKYDEFVESTVDSSMYEQLYIDKKKLEKEIENRHDEYWQYYYNEWERQIEYEVWKSTQDGSIQSYSLKENEYYKNQLKNQYLLRIKNQSKRYIDAKMDTTGLHEKYMSEFETHSDKLLRFFVKKDISLNKIPKQFKDIHSSKRTLNDITTLMEELLVKRDSALMSLPILDYQQIIDNEKRIYLKNEMFERLIQLPKNENALLDTTIYNTNSDYNYLYTYRYPVIKGHTDTIIIHLQSKILATDKSGFSSSSENIIKYIISENIKSRKQDLEINQKIEIKPNSTYLIDEDEHIEDIDNNRKTKMDLLENISEQLPLTVRSSLHF